MNLRDRGFEAGVEHIHCFLLSSDIKASSSQAPPPFFTEDEEQNAREAVKQLATRSSSDYPSAFSPPSTSSWRNTASSWRNEAAPPPPLGESCTEALTAPTQIEVILFTPVGETERSIYNASPSRNSLRKTLETEKAKFSNDKKLKSDNRTETKFEEEMLQAASNLGTRIHPIEEEYDDDDDDPLSSEYVTESAMANLTQYLLPDVRKDENCNEALIEGVGSQASWFDNAGRWIRGTSKISEHQPYAMAGPLPTAMQEQHLARWNRCRAHPSLYSVRRMYPDEHHQIEKKPAYDERFCYSQELPNQSMPRLMTSIRNDRSTPADPYPQKSLHEDFDPLLEEHLESLENMATQDELMQVRREFLSVIHQGHPSYITGTHREIPPHLRNPRTDYSKLSPHLIRAKSLPNALAITEYSLISDSGLGEVSKNGMLFKENNELVPHLNIQYMPIHGICNLEPFGSTLDTTSSRSKRQIDHHKFYDKKDSFNFEKNKIEASGILVECVGLTIGKTSPSSLFHKADTCQRNKSHSWLLEESAHQRYLPFPGRRAMNCDCKFCDHWRYHTARQKSKMKKLHNLPHPPIPKINSCDHFPSLIDSKMLHPRVMHFPTCFPEENNVSSNICESTSKAEVSFIHQQTPFAKTSFTKLEQFLKHSHAALNDPKFHMVLVYNSARDSLSIGVFTAEKGGLYFDQIIPSHDFDLQHDDLRLGVIFKGRALSGLKMVHLGSHTLRQKSLDPITHPSPSFRTNYSFPLPHPTAEFVPIQDRLAYRLACISRKSNPLLIQPPAPYCFSFTLARTCRAKLVKIYMESKLRNIFIHTKTGAIPQNPFGKLSVEIDEIDFYLDVFLPSMSVLMCTENNDEILYGAEALLAFSGNNLPDDNIASPAFKNPARVSESIVSPEFTRLGLAKMQEKYKHFLESLKSSLISDGLAQRQQEISERWMRQTVFESLGFERWDEYRAAPLILTQAGHHTRDFEHRLRIVEQFKNEAIGGGRKKKKTPPITKSQIFSDFLQQGSKKQKFLPKYSKSMYTRKGRAYLGIFEKNIFG